MIDHVLMNEDQKVPVKCWTPLIDEVTEKQLRTIAKLPFIKKHVSAMPDAHLGKGSTVGTVIATRKAIIPAAVGVDIGCFTGDTRIPLLDGKDYPIKDLVNFHKDIIVYSCTPSGKIITSKATAKLTRKQAPLIRVILDNDEPITCTPDHKFMMRDGSYKEAQYLQPRDSLMPLYRRIDKDGYVSVKQNYSGGSYQRSHWIMARSGLLGGIPSFPCDKTIIHHKNFVESDNYPSNLEFMSASQHTKYHRSLCERNTHWNSLDFKNNRVSLMREFYKRPEVRERLATQGTKNILEFMSKNRQRWLQSISGNGSRGRKYLLKYNVSEKGILKSKEVSNRIHSCPNCGIGVKSYIGMHNHKKGAHGYNHTVVSIQPLDIKDDVYCLSVPGVNNFALSAGVFVHNCGMFWSMTDLDIDTIMKHRFDIFNAIERDIPLGQNKHREKNDSWGGFTIPIYAKVGDKLETSKYQLGTLGGGNHFIEICTDNQNRISIMLHSGSRGIGNIIAQEHIKTADRLCKEWHVDLPDKDLAYLVDSHPEFSRYMHDLQWAQAYALENRAVMFELVVEAIRSVIGDFNLLGDAINCHHNYTTMEHHFDEDVWVTRKGAIRARKGDMGIIPGSMGDKSYIVRGKGCADAFCSAPHGAGRVLSRKKAEEIYTIEDMAKQTEGIVCKKDASVLDEIPRAYKPIEDVIRYSDDLVEVVHEIRQFICVKG